MNEILNIIFPVVILCGLGISLVASIFLASWMLEPINRAAGALKLATRFQLADFLGLMVLLQAALGVVGTGLAMEGEGYYWVALSLLVLLAVILWVGSVCAVSRAGIMQPLRRLTVMLLLVPGTLAAILALPIALVGTTAAITSQFDGENPDMPVRTFSVAMAATLVGLVIVAAVVRRLSFWALAATPLPQGLVKQHGSRGREVQAIDAAQHRQADGGDAVPLP
jgi:hypothetical protein